MWQRPTLPLLWSACVLLAFCSLWVHGFVPGASNGNRHLRVVSLQESKSSSVYMRTNDSRHSLTPETPSRRSFMTTASLTAAALLSVPSIAGAVDVRGTDVTPFNGLIYNYRGGDFGGLKASDLDEPSISYQDFMARLKAGEVASVEFLAPDGDVAYASFNPKEGGQQEAPIRIGEGYPVEQHDGWSSPAFAVRAVKNAGVPYKFTVPALSKFK